MLDNKNIIKLHYKNYISERANSITYAIGQGNKTILLKAPMKGGKTHLIINNIEPYIRKELGARVVLVSPVTMLIEQQEARAQGDTWGMYYQYAKCSLDTPNIITTPDSLPKVTEAIRERGDKYYIVIDEAHEVESSRAFRESFKNIEQEANNINCLGTLHLTATPQNLERSSLDKFDKVIKLEQDLTITTEEGQEVANPHIFKHGQEFIIKPMSRKLADIINLIERERRANPKSPIAIKLDDKKKLKALKLFYSNIEGIEFKFLSSNTTWDNDNEYEQEFQQEVKELRNDIKAYKEIGQQGEIIGFTSLINSGVEINNQEGTIFINFTNDTYNFINEIQAIGRFRNGLKRFILAIPPRNEEEQVLTLRGYQELYNEELETVTTGKEQLEKALTKNNQARINHLLESYRALKVDSNNKVIIDEILIRAEANNEYNKQYLRDAKQLLEQYKEQSELKFDKFLIDNLELTDYKDIDKAKKRASDLLGVSKDIIKDRVKSLRDDLRELEQDRLDLIANNEATILNDKEIELLNELRELKKEEPKIRDILRRIEKCNLTKGEALRQWITKESKDIKRLIQAYDYSIYNDIYIDNPKDLLALAYKGKKSERALRKRQYKTLEYLRVMGIKNGDRLSKRVQEGLINLYANDLGIKLYKEYIDEQDENKKKTLSNKIDKDLRDYLGLILIIVISKDNKYIRYSSQRKDIKDLI